MITSRTLYFLMMTPPLNTQTRTACVFIISTLSTLLIAIALTVIDGEDTIEEHGN